MNPLLTQILQPDTPSLDTQLKHQLLKQFQPQVLQRIKRGFQLYKDTVTVSNLVTILQDVLSPHTCPPSKHLTFIELFFLIDLKNLQRIKFKDFTNYLIEREAPTLMKYEYHMLEVQRLNEMRIAAEKVFNLGGYEGIGVLDNTKKTVSLLEKKTYKCVRNIHAGGKTINSLVYVEYFNAFALATNDKFMNFIEGGEYSIVERFVLPDSPAFQLVLQTGNTLTIVQVFNQQDSGRLVVGCNNGHMYEFDLKKIFAVMDKNYPKEEERKRKGTSIGELYKLFLINKILHNQPDLTCLIAMETVDILITGSNDSKVRLYDIRESGLQLNKQLQGHYKGIKGVSVSLQHKLIVSCSFDFDILVWNAYLQHPVARLQGHQAPLMGVACPKRHSIIISLDSKSIMKIWSAQHYQLLQNIVIFQNFSPNSTINFLYKDQSQLVIVWTKKLIFFQYVVNYNPKQTQDTDITAVKYSAKNLSLYIGARRALKIWSVKTGVQQGVFRDITRADISHIQIDGRQRQCFLGTIEGQIVSVDLFSGAVICTFASHAQEIAMLLYDDQNKLLVSGGWDRRIIIHNDTQHLEKIPARENVLRNIYHVSEKDTVGGTFSPVQMLIATHCKSNSVKIWDFEKGYLQTQLLLPNEVALIHFLDPYPILFIVDNKGIVFLISTRYLSKKPYLLLAQWRNMYSIQKSSLITSITFNKKDKQLFIGDEYGYVRIINIQQFLSTMDIHPIQAIGNKNPYRIQDYYYNSSSNANTHQYSEGQSKSIVPPHNIKQTMQIKAHNDKVNAVMSVDEADEPMLMTAGADCLVKLWSKKGEQRGVLRQGLTVNKNWNYQLHREWAGREQLQYAKIKNQLKEEMKEYIRKKKLGIIPFTEEVKYAEITNDQIYHDLKQGFNQKSKKSSNKII